MSFGKRKREEALRERAQLRAEMEGSGWAWFASQPAPPYELREAALRGIRRNDIWTVAVIDVAEGSVAGHRCRAGRLIGYEYGTTNSGIPHGDRRETNAVWIDLPAPLPEIRLVDAASTQKDYGLSLPPLGPGRTADGRWTVEGFVPSFAEDLLTPQTLDVLAEMVSVSAVVIRAGVVLAYGFEPYDAGHIRSVATTLAGVIESVPERAWGRADPLVAGTGVFPRRLEGGAGLSLGQRLIRPDWKGYGLEGKVPWQEAPDAQKHVTMSRQQAIDVWDVPPGTPTGVYVGTRSGGSHLPTVASTMGGER